MQKRLANFPDLEPDDEKKRTYSAKIACIDVYIAGTLKVSKNI